ncbi:MAG: hypothetical protein ACJA1A_000638 [Saprospiraceae bacterium]|jgi:hypothetical protein|tara:strand:+ start:616 stop:1224 length:609 start_codon:yes stop_codon:yes gene_type:complete
MYKLSLLFFVLLGFSDLVANPPDWSVNPADYQYNMIGMIRVVKLNNTFLNEENTIIRAIVNNETRGVVDSEDIIFLDGKAYMPITMYSNETSGDSLSFEVYVASVDSIFFANEEAIFDRFEQLGNPSSPFLLTVGICDSILELTEADIPLRTFYKAGQEIRILGQFTEIEDPITFDAPLVIVKALGAIDTSQSVIIQGNGCG